MKTVQTHPGNNASTFLTHLFGLVGSPFIGPPSQ